MSATFPPGPSGSRLLGCLSEVRRDPLAFLARITAEFGDIVHFRLAHFHVFLLNHPRDIEQVLVTRQDRFIKGRSLQGARRLFGMGLLTSDGALHDRQRHLIQPAFHRLRIDETANVITSFAVKHRERWNHGQVVDIAGEMSCLTLSIAGRMLFGADAERLVEEVRDVLGAVSDLLEVPALPFAVTDLLLRSRTRQLRMARAKLDRVLDDLVARRRGDPSGCDDLLAALMSAQEAEVKAERMSNEQLRDELVTLLLAAHDTTANALAWTWYLLGRHPDAARRLHAEIDAVLGSRLSTADDLAGLSFVRAVFAESMRLYPPAWLLARVAVEDHSVQGYVVPAGSIVVLSPMSVHRSATYFPDPLRFDPGRWLREEHRSRPRFSYFPFGGGSRGCLGEALAWTEGVLLLSTIAQRWTFQLVDPSSHPEPHPGLTLKPKAGIRMSCSQRRDA